MNQAQVTYFLTVAKYLNFTEASRQLFVAQSALSKQISKLEAELGLQLFERTSRYVKLTPAGVVLYRELQKWDKWLNHIIALARQADQSINEVLSIGVIHGIDLLDLKIKKLSAFSEAYSNVQIDIRRLAFQNIEEELKLEKLDIFIIFSFMLPEAINISEFTTHVLSSNRDLIAISRFNPVGMLAEITPEDLQDQTFITVSPQFSRQSYQNSLSALQNIGVFPKKVKFVNTIEDIMLFVESGLGYAVLSKSTRIFSNESIRMLDFRPESDRSTDIIAVWHKETKNPAVWNFAKFLNNPE